MTVTAFFSKNIFDHQPAADSRTSFEARNRLFGPGRKTETRPKKLKPLTDTGNLYGSDMTVTFEIWHLAGCIFQTRIGGHVRPI